MTHAPTHHSTRHHPVLRPDRRRCAGLSFAELILALAATALIGTAVAAMLQAVAYGAQAGTDLRDLIPKHRILSSRITDAVRGAKEILEVSGTEITLWIADLDDDGDYTSHEIAWIKYDAATDRVEYQTADSTHVATSVTLAQIAMLDTTLQSAGELDTQAWGRDVSAFAFAADVAPVDPQLVTWNQTLTVGNLVDTQVHATELGSHE